MSDTDARSAVLAFFAERGKLIADPKADLFETGIIDSMDLIELVTHLEATRGYHLAHDALTVDNFRNLEAIVSVLKGAHS